MSTGFVLQLQGATRQESIADVVLFTGQDASGSFGILPGRAPLITVLDYGLARFQVAGSGWCYLACPGGILYFADNCLRLATRRYRLDEGYERVAELLRGQLAREEAELKTVKDHLQRLEHELYLRLRRLEGGHA